MKRLSLLLSVLVVVVGCQKEDIFDIHKEWYKAKSYGGNTTMYIRFLSETEFEFYDEPNGNRQPYLGGKGKYIRNGNNVEFEFKTRTTDLFSPAYMQFMSGEWNNYPETAYEYHKSKLKVKYVRWTQITSEIHTEKEEYETTFSFAVRD